MKLNLQKMGLWLDAALTKLVEGEIGEDGGKVKMAVETIIFVPIFFHFKILGEQLGKEVEQPNASLAGQRLPDWCALIRRR